MTTLYVDCEVVPVDAAPGASGPPAECWRFAFASQTEARRKRLAEIGYSGAASTALLSPHGEPTARDVEDLRAVHDAAWERWRSASLDPLRGRVLAISVAISDIDPLCLAGEDETAILAALHELLRDHDPDRLVAWNGAGYDFPFLRARALICGLPGLASRLTQPKPWSGYLVDAMLEWPSAGRRYAKLSDVAAALGISRPEQVDGSGVLDAYLNGRLEEIRAHALDDVRVLREVWRVIDAARGAA